MLAGPLPFTTAQARARGLSDTVLQGAGWRQLLRGVWVAADATDSRELRLAAARLLLPPRAVLCGPTAAWIYGADVCTRDHCDIYVSCPKGARIRSRAGMVVSQESLAPADIWSFGPTSITSPVRTTFDCLRLCRGADRLVVADAMTHLGHVDLAELRRYFAGQRRLRNLRIAESLLDYVEPLTESPMESRTRWALLSAGLPRPVAQFELRDSRGEFVARLDLAYPERRVAVEYDGAWHWKRRREDDRRRDAVRALGWTVLVYSAADIYGQPDRVADDVSRALRLAATG